MFVQKGQSRTDPFVTGGIRRVMVDVPLQQAFEEQQQENRARANLMATKVDETMTSQ